jgi:hypothetical protein
LKKDERGKSFGKTAARTISVSLKNRQFAHVYSLQALGDARRIGSDKLHDDVAGARS